MASIYIETYGCALNQSDSEAMAGLLKKANFDMIYSIGDADIIILNSCTVKQPTEQKFFKRLEEIKEKFPNKKLIIAGCIPQTDPEKLEGYSLIGPYQIKNIVEVAEEVINGNTVELIAEAKEERLNLPKIRRNKIIEIIPICAGCLGEPCSYCKVKSARGDLISYDKNAIIQQAKNALNERAKEIWLTAQDTGCYGKDINENLPNLLNGLVKLNGNFFIRIGMMNPNHVLEFLDDLINVYKNEKIFKFLHIPVQSGNNEILKLMKRKYSVDDFKRIITAFRNEIPEITISTDIICGFPTEREEQFNDSIKLIREIRPDIVNISRFWPRQKTEAALMEGQIPGWETKKRSQLLTDISQNISRMNNERWFDWQGHVLIDERGIHNTWIGRNYAYKQIIVKGDYKLGDVINVKIEKVTSYDLRAVEIT